MGHERQRVGPADALAVAGVEPLERGQAADFISVDGNPLDDVSVLADRRRIAAVYKGGELVAERRRLVARLDVDRELAGEVVYGRRPRVRPDASRPGRSGQR